MLEIYLSRCLSAPASRPGLSDNTESTHRIAPLHCSRAGCFAMEWSLLDYFRQEMLVHERLLVRARTGRNCQSEGPSQRVKDSAITMAGLAPLYSRTASKTAPRWQGLPLRACVFHAQVCALHRTHISILAARQRQRQMAGLAPCERVFHARVCDLQITHISILAARQRRCHDGRAYPCERVFHAQVCAFHRTHLSILAAHQRQCHGGRACPCERVFHAQLCALHRTHISILATRQRQCHDGRACPLRACVPRSGV